MKNVHPDDTEYQCFTSKIGDALGGFCPCGEFEVYQEYSKAVCPRIWGRHRVEQ